jgi:hypothetical protein
MSPFSLDLGGGEFSASLGAGRLVQVLINNCALLGGNDTQILEVDF